MQTQYSVSGYRIDFSFHDYKLAIEIDKMGHSDKYWLQNKKIKTIKQEPGCKLIRIDSAKEDFDVFKAMNEIFRHIKKLTNK